MLANVSQKWTKTCQLHGDQNFCRLLGWFARLVRGKRGKFNLAIDNFDLWGIIASEEVAA